MLIEKRKRYLLSALIFAFLCAGIAFGLILLSKNQDLRQQASTNCEPGDPYCVCNSVGVCEIVSPDSVRKAVVSEGELANKGIIATSYTGERGDSKGSCSGVWMNDFCYMPGDELAGGYVVVSSGRYDYPYLEKTSTYESLGFGAETVTEKLGTVESLGNDCGGKGQAYGGICYAYGSVINGYLVMPARTSGCDDSTGNYCYAHLEKIDVSYSDWQKAVAAYEKDGSTAALENLYKQTYGISFNSGSLYDSSAPNAGLLKAQALLAALTSSDALKKSAAAENAELEKKGTLTKEEQARYDFNKQIIDNKNLDKSYQVLDQLSDATSQQITINSAVSQMYSNLVVAGSDGDLNRIAKAKFVEIFGYDPTTKYGDLNGVLNAFGIDPTQLTKDRADYAAAVAKAAEGQTQQADTAQQEDIDKLNEEYQNYVSGKSGDINDLKDAALSAGLVSDSEVANLSEEDLLALLLSKFSDVSLEEAKSNASAIVDQRTFSTKEQAMLQTYQNDKENGDSTNADLVALYKLYTGHSPAYRMTSSELEKEVAKYNSQLSLSLYAQTQDVDYLNNYFTSNFPNAPATQLTSVLGDPKALLKAIYGTENGNELYQSVVVPNKFNDAIANYSTDAGASLISVCKEMGVTNCNLDSTNATVTLSLMLDKIYGGQTGDNQEKVNIPELATQYSAQLLSSSQTASRDAVLDKAGAMMAYSSMSNSNMGFSMGEWLGNLIMGKNDQSVSDIMAENVEPYMSAYDAAEQAQQVAIDAADTFNASQAFSYATANRSSLSDYTWGLSYGNALMNDDIFNREFTKEELGINTAQEVSLTFNQITSQVAGVDVAQNIATNYATSKYYNYTGPADTNISNIALTGAENLGVLDYNYQSVDSSYYTTKTVKSWGENIGQAATYVGSLYAASQMNQAAANQAMYTGTSDFEYVDPVDYAKEAAAEFKSTYHDEAINDLYNSYVAIADNNNVDPLAYEQFIDDPEVKRSSDQLDYERLEKVVAPTAAAIVLPVMIASGVGVPVILGAASSAFSLYQGAGMKAQALELQRIDIQSRENAVVQSYIDNGADAAEIAKVKEDINNQVVALNKQGDLMLASSAVAAVTSAGGWATSLASAGQLTGTLGDVALTSGQVLTKVGQAGGIALNSYNTVNSTISAYDAFSEGNFKEGAFSALGAFVSASGVAGNTFGLVGPTTITNKIDFVLDAMNVPAGSGMDLEQVSQACYSGSDAYSEKDCTNAWIGLALSAGQNVAQISSSYKTYKTDVANAQIEVNNAKIVDIQKQIDAIDTEIVALGGPNKGLREGLQINDLVLQRTLLADQIKTIDPNFKIANINSSEDYTNNVMKISLDLENKAQAAIDAGQNEQALYLLDQAQNYRNKSDEVAYIRDEINSIDEQVSKKGLLLSTSELADLQKSRNELVTELESSFKDLSAVESIQKQSEVILEVTKANTAFEELNKTLAINTQKLELVETYKPSDELVNQYKAQLEENSDSIKLETDADKRLKSLAVLEDSLTKLSDLESQRDALSKTSNADSEVGKESIAKLDAEIDSLKKITDGLSTDNRSIFQKIADAVSPNKESRNAYYESVDLTHEAETLRNKLATVDADSEEAQGIKEQLAEVNRQLVDQKYVLSQDAINPNQTKTIFQSIAEFVPNLVTNRQIADLKTAAKKLGTANLDMAEQMAAKQTEIDKLRAGGPVTSEDAAKITQLESELADLSLTAKNILKGKNALIKVDQSGDFTKYTVTDAGEKAGIKQTQLDILNNELKKFETFKRSETGIEKFKIYSGTESFKDQDIFLLAELEAYGSGRRGTVFGALPGMGKTDVVMPFNILLKQRLTNEPQFIVFPESKLMKPWTSDANYTPNKEFIDYVESEFGKGSVVIVKANDPNVDTAAIAKAKFVITTKEVAFDLQNTGTSVGVALRNKWKSSFVHADEVDWTFNPNENYKVSGQQVALQDKAEYSLYLNAQKQVLGVDENGNFSSKGLSTLRELVNQLETSKSIPEGIVRTADGKGGKFADVELDKQVLNEWLGTWGGQSRIPDLDMSADISTVREKINNYLSSDTSDDTHSRRAELAMINETVNFLSRVPGEDYGLSTTTRTNNGIEETINSIAPKDQNRDTGRSYSAVAESLLYNTLGAKVVGANGQVDLGKLTVGENGSEINYAALMLESKGFSLYTGTPETVSKLYKMAYGIELQTFTDSAVDDSIARFKSSDSKLFTDLESQISDRLKENRDQVFVNMVSGQKSNEMALNDLINKVSSVDTDNKVYKKLMLVGASGNLSEYDVVNEQLQHVRDFATTSELNTRTAELNTKNERFIKFYEYGAHVGVDTKNNVDVSRVIGLCSGCDATTFSQGINRVRVQVDTLDGGGSVTKSAPMDVVWLDAPSNKTNPTIDDFETSIKDKQVVNEALAEVSFKETLLRNSVDSTITDLIDLASNGKKGFLGFGAYKANQDLVTQLETAKQKWKETTDMNYMLGSDDMSAQTKLEKTAAQVSAMYEELTKLVAGTGEPAKLLAERADGAVGNDTVKLSFAGDDDYKVLGETPSYRQIVDLINQSSKHLENVDIAFTNRSSSPEVVQSEVAKSVGDNSTADINGTTTRNNAAENNSADTTADNTNLNNSSTNVRVRTTSGIGFASFISNLWSGNVDEDKLLSENADLIEQNRQAVLDDYQNQINALNEQLGTATEDSEKESLTSQISDLEKAKTDEFVINAAAETMTVQQLANDYRSGGLKNLLPKNSEKGGAITVSAQPLSVLLPGINKSLENLKNILPQDMEKGGTFTLNAQPMADLLYGGFNEEAFLTDKQAEITAAADQLKQEALDKKATEAKNIANEINKLNKSMRTVTDVGKAQTIQAQIDALTTKQNDIKAEQDDIQQQDFSAEATANVREKYANDKDYLRIGLIDNIKNVAGKIGTFIGDTSKKVALNIGDAIKKQFATKEETSTNQASIQTIIDKLQSKPEVADLSKEEVNFFTKAKNDSNQLAITRDLLGTLVPKRKITIEGTTYYFLSDILKTNNGNGDIQAVLYTINKDGLIIPRSLYKSHSDGGWRSTPYYALDVYSKGYGVVYTQETKVHDQINSILNKLEADGHIANYAGNLIREKFNVGEILDNNINNFQEEVHIYKDGGVLANLQKYPPGHYSEKDGELAPKVSDLDSLTYPDGFIPDFSQSPVVEEEVIHTLLGHTVLRKYIAYLNGRPVVWVMANDDYGRVWVDRIYFADSKITTYGVYDEVINSGVLTNKPLEYASQAYFIDKSYKSRYDDRYFDITPLLDHLLPVKQYRQARNIERSAKPLSSNGLINKKANKLDLTQDANKFLDDYAAQLSTQDGADLAKIDRVKNFFTQEINNQITGIYNDLLADKETVSEEEIANIKANLQFVLERAFDQHLDNPEQYVSHGFDHTLNVIKYTDSIIESNYEVVQKVQEKYGIGDAEAKFLLRTVSLFHDFGYPVSEASKLGKAAHGMAGADIINYGKVDVDGQEVLLQNSLLKLMNSDNQEIIFDLRDSILFHSADKVERNYGVKIKTSRGDFLLDNNEFIRVYNAFSNDGGKPTSVEKVYVYADDASSAEEIKNQLVQALESDNIDAPIPEIEFVTKKFEGRKVDLLSKKDNLLGLEFSEVALMTSPLQAIIRLADNMDMQTDRFSPIQREPLFQAFYKELGNPESELYIDNLGFENLLDKAEKAVKADKTSQDAADRISDLKRGIAAFISSYKQSKGGDADEAFSQAMNDLNNLNIGASEDYWKSFVFGEIAKRPAFANVTDTRAMEIKNIALEQNSSSYRHFGGCEAVRGVKVTPEGVFVEVDQDIFDNLNKTTVEEESLFSSIDVGIGEYQIWRMSQAYKSIKFHESDSDLPIYINGNRYYEGVNKKAPIATSQEADNGQLSFNSLCSDCEQVRLATKAGVEEADTLIKESEDLIKQAAEAKNNNDANLANSLNKQAEAKKQEALKKLNDTRYQIVDDYGRQNQCVQTYLNAWINTREALIRKTKADIDNAIDSVYKATALAEEMMDSKQMAIKTNTILGMGGETVYKPLTDEEVDDIGDLLFGNKEKNIEGLQSWAAFDVGSDGKLSRTVLKGSLLDLDNSVVADKVSPIRVFLRNFAISSRQLLVMDHLKQAALDSPALLLNFAKLQVSISPTVSISPAISITPVVSTSPTPTPSSSPTPTPSQAIISITPAPSSVPSGSANENGLNWRTILNVLATTLSLTLFGSIINNLSVVKASETSQQTTETVIEESINQTAASPTPVPTTIPEIVMVSNPVVENSSSINETKPATEETADVVAMQQPKLPVKKIVLDTALPSKYIVSDPYAKYELQSDGTILFTERDEWNPVDSDIFPDYTTNRDTADYLKTIELFNVDESKRYRRDSSVTYCNIYVSDVTKALGVPIPRWENGEKMDADDMYSWLQSSFAQDELGWKEVTAAEAQELANQGIPTVASTPRYDVSGGTAPGHIAMIVPGEGETVDGTFYPASAQAGRINFDDGSSTNVGFAGAIKHDQEIKYFVNDSSYEFVQP